MNRISGLKSLLPDLWIAISGSYQTDVNDSKTIMESNGSYLGVIRPESVFGRTREKMSTQAWLRTKETDDGAEGLWRIHDDIYDFSGFVQSHPGGKFWLEITKGTDITEAFEIHHFSDKAEALLGKFKVRKARKPKISLITFEEKGFYKTLKKKIRNSGVVSTGSSWQSRVLIDSLLFGFIVTSLLAARHCCWWSLIAGFFLYMVSVAAHNFFHMKDNVRMYYFNLSLLSFRDWRISHALSHHVYANTFLDLEISLFEPIFQYLPKEDKSFIARFLPWLISPFVFAFLFFAEFLKRCADVLIKSKPFHWDDYLALTIPLFMWSFSNEGTVNVLIAWGMIIASGSFFFGLVGLTAAHHHPEIYHEGDYLGSDKDFGILQLAAVRDRKEISGNFFLASITFGDHALHHLFPTIDLKNLIRLQPYFEETCEEFNIDFKQKAFGNLVTGMYQQLARNYVNGDLLIRKSKIR